MNCVYTFAVFESLVTWRVWFGLVLFAFYTVDEVLMRRVGQDFTVAIFMSYKEDQCRGSRNTETKIK